MVRYGAGPHDLNGENYDVENDFHGVYFFGAVGLGLMLAFWGILCCSSSGR